MRYVHLRALALAGLLLAACSQDRPVSEEPPGEPGQSLAGDGARVCLEGQEFVAAGPMLVEAAGPADAREISSLRWSAHDGCERLVIDLQEEDGSPAEGTGPVEVEVLRELGVVRVSLRDVERVNPDATEGTFSGPLARAAYVVRSRDGRSTFVDVHLGDGAEAYVDALAEPARVVIDLRPDGAQVSAPPASDTRTVVLEPRPGPASYPLTVTGYARTFEANVVVRIEQDGRNVFETFTTATSWLDAWGHYSFVIDDGPSGPIQLRVGEYSARDGSWQGVTVELEMR